jgi:hypothetical protein
MVKRSPMTRLENARHSSIGQPFASLTAKVREIHIVANIKDDIRSVVLKKAERLSKEDGLQQ